MILPIMVANPLYFLIEQSPIVRLLWDIKNIEMIWVLFLQIPSYFFDVIPPDLFKAAWCRVAHDNNPVHTNVR
jgi:hypothetical protein